MRHRFPFLALTLAGFASLLGAAAPGPNLGETIERWEHLHVETPYKVSNLRLTSGNLTVTLSTGPASVVRAGDESVGLFLSGVGSLEYRSVDPIEFPLLIHNLRTATSL